MSYAFAAKKAIAVLLKPPLFPLLLLLLGLILLRWRPRAARLLLWGGLALAVLLSTPTSVRWIAGPLEAIPTIDEPDLARAQAIVILGGGQRRANPEYDGAPSVNRITLERLRFGAQLARASGLPILVSGGAPTGTVAEAVLMAQALEADFQQPVKWVEAASLDTADNARYSAQMLKGLKIGRVALVTHALHMRRARAEFAAQGIEVIAAPMGFMSDPAQGEEFFDYLPGMNAAYTGWYATHEWLGILAQKLRF